MASTDLSQKAEAAAESRREHAIHVECPKCGSDRLHRVEREGFMENYIYSLFGYYPWKCSACKAYSLLKKRSVRKKKHTHREEREQ